MERTSIDTIYGGIVDKFKNNGAEVISEFGEQIVPRWIKRNGLGGSIDSYFELQRGIVMRHEDKLVGLALGKIDGSCFYNPLKLQFGMIPEKDIGKYLTGRVEDLPKLIQWHGDDWAYGEFRESCEGEVWADGCWANSTLFTGGSGSKNIDVHLAYDIVARTMKNGFTK